MRRRTLLKLLAGSALLEPAARVTLGQASPRPAPGPAPFSADDEAFLDDMQRRACLFFVEQASAATGQVLDRAVNQNTTGAIDPRRMASVSATGFGLTALCIADQRGFQPHAQVVEQVRRTLRFHADVLPHDHGFFSHFNDRETGKLFGNSEVSSIDSAIFFCGALTARAYFPQDAEIVKLATSLYERVDWPWMLNGGPTFSMGLRKGKFLEARWNHYCELMMIPLLAMASPTHPVSADVWTAFSRPRIKYAGFDYISASDPLFVHQYSHAWFDFRFKRDQFADYFANSILATRAHEAFCLALGKPYLEDYWGISASDSEHGYTAWGGPNAAGQGFGGIDGSVVPNATAGSLPFLPAPCLRVQRALKQKYGKHAWGRYGFCDAFHPDAQWYDPDVLGIDLGISVLMAENLRTGFVWKTFAKNPEVGVAFQKAGFRPVDARP
jgi:hypothetical protein